MNWEKQIRQQEQQQAQQHTAAAQYVVQQVTADFQAGRIDAQQLEAFKRRMQEQQNRR